MKDLEFMAGHWQGELEGGTADEHWMAPLGDSMMCVFRYVKAGKATFYEMLLMEQTDTGPAMRLKHFNPGLVGWEEKEQVYSYPLVALESGRATFRRPDGMTTLVYHRTSNDSMSVLLEQTKGRKKKTEVFSYGLV